MGAPLSLTTAARYFHRRRSVRSRCGMACRDPALRRIGMTCRKWYLALGALACLMALPATARAQSAIAGVVKDSSGAVLPGVTVEAASDQLIEKSKVAVTDGSGAYKIIDLRPGTYIVTL